MHDFKLKALPAALATVFGAAALGSAAADAAGWYVGGGLGVGLGHQSGSDQASLISDTVAANGFNLNQLTRTKSDDSKFAWKVFAGYQFNDYFGLEAAYIDLSSFKSEFTGTVDGPEGVTAVIKSKVDGAGVWAVGSYPIPWVQGLSVYAKLGGFRWHIDTTGDATVVRTFSSPVPGPIAIGSSGTDLAEGAGVRYDFSQHWGAQLDFDHLKLGNSEANVVTGAVRFRF